MVKRISRVGYGIYREDKKYYHMSHGTEVYEYIPHHTWVNEVVTNPNGLTAIRAKEQKDPDLGKIEVPVIGINHDHRLPNQVEATPKQNKYIKSHKPKTRMINIDPIRAKKLGWLEAGEGRAIKQHKIPMLEDKKEKKSK